MKNKLSIVDLVRENGCKSVAEIGTGTARFSKYILEHTDVEKLYCIDPWENWEFKKASHNKHYKSDKGSNRLEQANEVLREYGDKVQIIRKHSQDALNDIPDGSLDACCIDGDLTFDGLLNDLRTWFDKVKDGGVIWGHSYRDKADTRMIGCYGKITNIPCSTKKVLDAFASRYGQDVQVTTSCKDHSWYFVKKPYVSLEQITLDICIHCYNYQHRLCWMLSSILQQKGDIPNIVIRISHAPNNGNPTTEKVCEFFCKKGLNIIETELTEKQASNRAIARNIQVKETDSDWMLFADSDLVYDPRFFEDIKRQVMSKYCYETKCIGADRFSLNIPFCIKYFEEDERKYPCVIEDVATIAQEWPVRSSYGKMTAAGYFQLANTDAIRSRNGFYSSRENDLWRGTRSDRRFRVMMGGRVPIDAKPQYHLNHDRYGPELQR